jgi:hypothetical protein
MNSTDLTLKKPDRPFQATRLVPSNLAISYKTHGFPSPSHDGFGFDQDEHHDTSAMNRKSNQPTKKAGLPLPGNPAYPKQPGNLL